MSRTELEDKAVEAIMLSMEYNGVDEEEIREEARNASDEDLRKFLKD